MLIVNPHKDQTSHGKTKDLDFPHVLHVGRPSSEYKSCVVCFRKYLFLLRKLQRIRFGVETMCDCKQWGEICTEFSLSLRQNHLTYKSFGTTSTFFNPFLFSNLHIVNIGQV